MSNLIKRFQTLQTAVRQEISVEQLIAYEAKLRREELTPEVRNEIMRNLHPCMDCGDPVYVQPDPSIQSEGGAHYYTSCRDCHTLIGRFFKKIKLFFQNL